MIRWDQYDKQYRPEPRQPLELFESAILQCLVGCIEDDYGIECLWLGISGKKLRVTCVVKKSYATGPVRLRISHAMSKCPLLRFVSLNKKLSMKETT